MLFLDKKRHLSNVLNPGKLQVSHGFSKTPFFRTVLLNDSFKFNFKKKLINFENSIILRLPFWLKNSLLFKMLYHYYKNSKKCKTIYIMFMYNYFF